MTKPQTNKMFKIKTTLVFCLLSISLFSQKKSMLFYDSSWKPTTKENHAFYRPMPLKEIGELVLIEDFYKNGSRQMQGYVLKENQENYIGDIYWYDENGMENNFSQYYNPTKNNELLFYYPDGKIWKKVLYKNEVKEGLTTIYKKDGNVLMDGTYKKGKPYSGDFTRVKNADDYYGESFLENEAEISMPVMVVEAEEIENSESEVAKVQPKASVYEKLYWVNTDQVAQIRGYKKSDYGTSDFKLISQKNYNQSKQLSQDLKTNDIEYGYRIKNGIEYQYYTQNDFVVGIKSETPYKDTQINGKVISYFTNGKISKVETYKTGIKDGETLEYNEFGVLKKKLIYKKDAPFEGDFKIKFNSDIFIYTTYKNGLQTGDVVAKTKSDSIITKGIYKNGKAFQGTFFDENVEKDRNEIITVENFKKKGKQIVFTYNYLQAVETHTIQNEMKNGESVFYEDGIIKSKIIYKNDKPYEGTLINKNEILTYKNGKLTEQIIFKDYNSDDQKTIRQYENNLPTRVSFVNQFILTETPQKEYIGIYKNGLAYDGYFSENESEFKTVEYYEKGEIKHQFSNDYLKNMDNYRFPEYDLKSTYKDGKVFDGMEYLKESKSYISKNWQKGKLQSIDWDLFAIHYFNRIHIAHLNNQIEISEYQSKGKIIIEEKNGRIVKSIVLNNRTLASNTIDYIGVNDPLLENTTRIYLIKNNTVVALDINHLNTNETINDNEENNLNILYKIYSNLIYNKNSVEEYFSEIKETFTSEGKYSSLLTFNGPSENNDDIAGLQTNENSQITVGIHITQNPDSTYNLQLFYNNESIEFVKKIPFSNLKSEIKKLTKTLEKKH